MKRKLIMFLLLASLVTGCKAEENQKQNVSTQQDAEETTVTADESNNILIAYFSWADNTIVQDEKASVDSALRHYESVGDSADYVDATSSASILQPGNVSRMASWIQELTI